MQSMSTLPHDRPGQSIARAFVGLVRVVPKFSALLPDRVMGRRCIASSDRSAAILWFSRWLHRPIRCHCVAPSGLKAAARDPRRRPEVVPMVALTRTLPLCRPLGCSAAACDPHRNPKDFPTVVSTRALPLCRPSGRSAVARGPLHRPRASTIAWYAPHHLPTCRNATIHRRYSSC